MGIKKNNVKFLLAGVAGLLIIIASVFLITNLSKKSDFKISEQGVLQIKNIETPEFQASVFNQNEYFDIDKVVFKSRGENIYALLIKPHSADESLPGAVLLPGAGVSKESALDFGATISLLGFYVLILDQRGVGETKGTLSSFNDDIEKYNKGEDTYQHLMIYDALVAANVLRQIPKVGKGYVVLIGESLGGRNAIIATAIEPSIKGVIGISTGGLDLTGNIDDDKAKFLKSIDSNTYASLISPRKMALLHNLQDTNIPFEAAARTYQASKEPSILLYINSTNQSCKHGYCDEMHDALKDSLKFVIN